MFGNGGFMWGGGFMWIFWLLIIVLIVVLIRAMAGAGGGSGGQQREHKTALEILEERYARGEIDDDEFQRRKRELTGRD